MADSIIYYDYTCPYSYRAACWLRLEEAGESSRSNGRPSPSRR